MNRNCRKEIKNHISFKISPFFSFTLVPNALRATTEHYNCRIEARERGEGARVIITALHDTSVT